jgi:hypothetical protein
MQTDDIEGGLSALLIALTPARSEEVPLYHRKGGEPMVVCQ